MLFAAATPALGQKVYWTDVGRLLRANVDGTQVETLLKVRLDRPLAIAVDSAAGKVYWSDDEEPSTSAAIRRANLDGSAVEDLITTNIIAPTGLALDVAGGMMFWTDSSTGRISKSNLDGSGAAMIVQGQLLPKGIAFDPVESKLYWAAKGDDFFSDVIRRANTDGSGIEDVVIIECCSAVAPHGVGVDEIHRKLYWRDNQIRRANLDGTEQEDLGIAVTEPEGGIAIDAGAGRMYWADDTTYSADLNGGDIETIANNAGAIRGISVDVERDRVYWCMGVGGGARVRSAPASGGPVTDDVTPILAPHGLALDRESGQIYWGDPGSNILPDGAIRRCELNGAHVATIVETGWVDPTGVALDVADRRVYWAGRRAFPSPQVGRVQRASVDDGVVEDLVTNGLISPRALALDVAGGSMYWTDVGSRDIRRANLDGSAAQFLVQTGLVTPNAIALDPDNGRMLWTDSGNNRVMVANLDGTDATDFVPIGPNPVEGIAIDEWTGQVYWGERLLNIGAARILRAESDGSAIIEAVPSGATSPKAMVIDPRATGDVNGDGTADLADFAKLQRCFAGTSPTGVGSGCSFFDGFPADGDVDLNDATVFITALSEP